MRDRETDVLLTEVRKAVVKARAAGVAVHACIFDATIAAVDEGIGWPSAEARKIADDACRAVEPPTARAVPRPDPPFLAHLLLRTGNWLAARKEGN